MPKKLESKRSSPKKKSPKIKKKTVPKHARGELSPSEIREKLKAHQLKQNGGVIKPLSENEESEGSNTPNAIGTTEKLKDALRSGAVNFSDKTKKVLGEILKSH